MKGGKQIDRGTVSDSRGQRCISEDEVTAHERCATRDTRKFDATDNTIHMASTGQQSLPSTWRRR